MRHVRRFSLVTLLVASLCASARAETASNAPVVVREALVLEASGRAGRNTLFTDAVEAELAAGTWRPPQPGDTVVSARDGTNLLWSAATANDEGWFSGRAMRGGWAYVPLVSSEPQVVLLNLAGHSMAYVNGEPRAGDIYGYGYVSLPTPLRAGTNDVLIAAGRGRLRIQWSKPLAPVFLQNADLTTPDLIVGEKVDTWAAAVLVNATPEWLRGASVLATVAGRTTRTRVGEIPPFGVRKIGFQLRAAAPREAGKAALSLIVESATSPHVRSPALSVDLRIRQPHETHKRTFVSDLDGSVQYYAVNPGAPLPAGVSPALFLSLHGASVEALGQAESYGPKRWGTLVSPTNRRPYGFDWEEWGRLDALEVLAQAKARLNPDPTKIYLTGHSMGGHGTWNLGVTFPDHFAAIAPSAGWISFFSYAGTDAYTNATPVEAMLRRAAASSDTLAMATNYLQQGIYIVHGDADDNVPVREARRMREVLGTFHSDFAWHEQPGAGHWWGNSDEPGTECVDWPPAFDLFARHRLPESSAVRRVHFVTVNPGVNARDHWLALETQVRALEPSRADALWDPGLQRVTATTHNVARLALDVATFGAAPTGFRVELDGQSFSNLVPMATTPAPSRASRHATEVPPLRFERDGTGRWSSLGEVSAKWKGPHRAGPFKDAFRHRMIFVYGTTGTVEENAWAFAKARFDAESFWYRGNGSIDVLPDTAFQPERFSDRGVILYGHAEMNSAWQTLLADSPVQVHRGSVRVGGRTVSRNDVACLFLQPRPDSEFASVGVIAGTGLPGLRVTQRLPYFLAGTGYPDCLLIGADALRRGNAGIVAAGFFGNDWSVSGGDFAWGEPAAFTSR